VSLPDSKFDDEEGPTEWKVRVGALIGGKYRVDRVLGEGGMGAVYAATHSLTRKRVAIKMMLARLAGDEKWVARFMREANAAGRIHHPNVVDIYDVGEDEGVPFLVMEMLVGKPLSVLFEDGPLDPKTAIDLLMPALRGIAAAHAEGIVHRDLKPENVFVLYADDGTITGAKVLDFGISKARREDEAISSLTRSGAVMGTPHYMSLEQIRGVKDVDLRTDVYSIGVMLYEAMTGHFPFEAETFPALAIEVATGTARPLRDYAPDVDPKLAEIVHRAMARRREDRFDDVPSLAAALEPFGSVKFGERNSIGIRIDQRPEKTRDLVRAEAPTTPREIEAAPTVAAKRIEPRSGEREVPRIPVPDGPGADRTRIAEEPRSDPELPPLAPSRRMWLGIVGVLIALIAITSAYLLWPSGEPPARESVRTEQAAPPVIIAPAVADDPEPPPIAAEPEPPLALDPPPPVQQPREVEERPRPRVRRPVVEQVEQPVERPPAPQQEEPVRRGGVRTGGVSAEEF
jgi:serine/threonine protein kinase